jgi:hypothetical protein
MNHSIHDQKLWMPVSSAASIREIIREILFNVKQ